MQKGETMKVERAKVDAFVEKRGGSKSALIPILQDVQNECNWLPPEALRRVALKLEVPLVDVYGVATFYRSFSLKPRGKHIGVVCLGTACHVRGGQRIVDAIYRELGVKPGETTDDMNFTLETVNCLGCCAIGPILLLDGEYHGQMTAQRSVAMLREKVWEEE
jgi:NADH-quinone oxidoreductase subunit E